MKASMKIKKNMEQDRWIHTYLSSFSYLILKNWILSYTHTIIYEDSTIKNKNKKLRE